MLYIYIHIYIICKPLISTYYLCRGKKLQLRLHIYTDGLLPNKSARWTLMDQRFSCEEYGVQDERQTYTLW